MSKTANLPKVTIITVTYNAEATLERTLQSVAALDYAPLEYLLIDGGSSDGTLALLQAYEAVIDHWVSEPDEGLYDAMNKGMALASGDYLWFLNAGDEAARSEERRVGKECRSRWSRDHLNIKHSGIGDWE